MLSEKQGSILALLLVVGSCYVPSMLVSLFIVVWPITRLGYATEPGELPILLFVTTCSLVSILWVTVLAARKIKGLLSTERFYLFTVILFVVFLALGYAVIVAGNLLLNMGWSLL